KIYEEKQVNILKAIEEGKVVEKIKVMADSIADIPSIVVYISSLEEFILLEFDNIVDIRFRVFSAALFKA
ncbi:Methyl-accepting chemotaxis sensory transducer, partial [human gut metagenome]